MDIVLLSPTVVEKSDFENTKPPITKAVNINININEIFLDIVLLKIR